MPRLSSTLAQTPPWGSHLCAFYRSAADLHMLICSYIEAGLADHEGCLWILPPWLSPSAATILLQRTVPNVYDYLQTGQLDLVPSSEWYRPEAPLNPEAIFATCLRKVVQVAPRFTGFRVTGDSSWLQSSEQRARFLAYEHGVTEAVGKANIVALCTYPTEAWTPYDILTVWECHDTVLLCDRFGWREVEIQRD